MINVEIIQNTESLAIEISKYLIENKYALQTHINKIKAIDNGSELTTVKLFFITKALLFDMIYKDLQSKYKSYSLKIYAAPVSHIDKEFGESLRLNLKAV
jgi:hypothetical protein